MVVRDRDIKNAARREHLSQQSAKSKSKAKLSRRLEIKRAEAADSTGELKRIRLEQNVPRTIEGTREWDHGGSEDARVQPVKLTSGTEEGDSEIQLDMAGLESLFIHQEEGERGPILLTTSPRPHGPTYAFLSELQSLLGGKQYAEVLPRKNARFELSRVGKWAKRRGYSGIVVVGEDNRGEPATMTISLLPHGPTAHFRLTSISLHRSISNSARPTSHVPELVLSNFSTPLGLSTGRLLQSLFPPLPNIVGRQVVAIHNQRDFIFVRRFRYMFALRETESSIKMAKSAGLDEQLRTRMQEIGPRFCLKLRWIKRGTIDEGRRRGANGVTGPSGGGEQSERVSASGSGRAAGSASGSGAKEDADMDTDAEDAMGQTASGEDDDEEGALDLLDSVDGQQIELATAQDAADEEAARREMLAASGELGPDPGQGPATETSAGAAADGATVPDAVASTSTSAPAAKKRKRPSGASIRRPRTHSPSSGRIVIPRIAAPKEIPKSELPHHRKLKKGASLLDSLAVTVGLGRGGSKKAGREWEWDPRSQVSRRRFAM